MGRLVAMLGVSLLLPLTSGCRMSPNARYIYQDGEFGVIGIPTNSPYGLKKYRQQAEELMAQHFPDGFEIVRAEEVVEGQRVLDKSRRSEFESQPSIDALSQKISLGKVGSMSSLQVKDSLPILESRIIYKRRSAEGPQGANGFAASSKGSPELYLDPNDMARCREKLDLVDLKTGKTKPATVAAKSLDTDAKKVAHEVTK